jgi:hypothetical protein
MNKPINYKLAKLLNNNKEIKSAHWYNRNEALFCKFITPILGDSVDLMDLYDHKVSVEHCEAPMISDVIVWLYEKYNIWISVQIDTTFNKGKHCIMIYRDRNVQLGFEVYSIDDDLFGPYDTPKLAYEAAIEHTLNNLI